MLEHVVPDKSGRGIGERIIAESVAVAESTKGFVEVVGGIGFGAPGMTVGGVDAAAIEVVEQHILLGQCVMIGRNKCRVNAKVRIAVALWQIAKHLVIGFVFLEDVEDVLKHGRLAHSGGNGHGCLAGAEQELRLLDLRHAAILKNLRGVFAQGFGRRQWNFVGCSQEQIDLPGCVGGLADAAAESLHVWNIKEIRVSHDRSGKPVCGQKTLEQAVRVLGISNSMEATALLPAFATNRRVPSLLSARPSDPLP